MQIKPHNSGLVFAVMLGGWHLLWSCLVFTGLAQPLLDFVLRIHMIQLSYTIAPFDLLFSLTLIVVTALIGYALGYISAMVWNKIHG